ncbi:MAG: cupin domain-containing protein [Chloroflexi bacterium]|nr:cupin domain-containing protein [Chloroflexota bacterium]
MTAIEAPAPFQVAKVRPPMVARGKISNSLARSGLLGIGVQVVSPDGGETNLHSHPGIDSSWMVLDGKAIFYTTNDEVVAELEKNELVMIPSGTPYWFKASGDEPLVILHITARTPGSGEHSRIDYTPRTMGGENRVAETIPGQHFEG